MTQTANVGSVGTSVGTGQRVSPATSPDAGPATGATTCPAAGAVETIELLGLVAHLEHEAFTRLAADAALAPGMDVRLALSRFASTAVTNRDQVLARIAELGADPQATLGQFDHVLDDFDARTCPSTWTERLLTSYVGYGVADDFCRLLASRLDATSAALVVAVLDDTAHADLAVAAIAQAGQDDDVLVSRLALWGRRLGGEALGVVQALLTSRPALLALASDAPSAEGHTGTGSLFGSLTGQHTRRMGRLGLTA